MSDLMPIGRFAQLTRLSAKALRLYDELGVLSPAAIDFATGYRFYSREQLPLAQRVKQLRDMAMPLADIRALLEAGDSETARAHLARHRARLEGQIAVYRRAISDLQALDRWYQHVGKEHAVSQQSTSHQCSFCGKRRGEVARLIAGPNGVFICNECVVLCNEIMDDATPAKAQETPERRP